MSLRREFLSAYLSVSSDPGSYGHMTLLQLPTDTQTQGPQQVQTQFLSSPQVSTELNLLRQQGTQVLYGNLLTLPIAGGLLYVEPVYIERSNQESSFPQLSRVLVSFGGKIGYAPTLAEALTQVFGSAGTATTTPGQAATPQAPQAPAATPPQQGTAQAPAAGAVPGAASPQVTVLGQRDERRAGPAAHRPAAGRLRRHRPGPAGPGHTPSTSTGRPPGRSAPRPGSAAAPRRVRLLVRRGVEQLGSSLGS